MRLPCQDIRKSPSNVSTQSSPISNMDNNVSDNSGYNSPLNSGMTSAISTAAPKEYDLKLTKGLEEALKPYGCFESDEQMTRRMEVLSKLDRLVKDWVRDVSISKNIPPAVAEQLGGKIYTFGSYRLGVHNRGADIDALCVVPKNIDRIDYFSTFYDLLKEQSEVTHLRAVPESFVPVIKMSFDDIEIDMLFARVATKEVPDDLELTDDSMLKNLDQKCVRSLNGCRVTDEILRLVPNIESFRLALRAIRLWAKKNGIYSNALGYLGGVSWAMLVARACQLYPNAAAATIVLKFFLVFTKWKWPQPVLLKPMQNLNPITHSFSVWDPRVNVSDRFHLMPIITPAYPQQNSTFNVSLSTRQIMVNCLHAGFETTQKIYAGSASWDSLFYVPNFFQQYKHFIVLLASSNNDEDHLDWYGLVESRIRHLIGTLERNPQINLPRVWPKSYTPINAPAGRCCTCWFIGLDFVRSETQNPETKNIDLTHDISSFTDSVISHSHHLKSFKDGMELDARYVRRKDLIQYLSPEICVPPRKDGDESRKRKRSITSGSGDTPKKNRQSDKEKEAILTTNGSLEVDSDNSLLCNNSPKIEKTEEPEQIEQDDNLAAKVPEIEVSEKSDISETSETTPSVEENPPNSPLNPPTKITNILHFSGTKEVVNIHREMCQVDN